MQYINDIIIDYYHSHEHYSKFKDCILQIQIPQIIEKMTNHINEFDNNNSHEYLFQFLKTKVTNPIHFLNILSTCDCCIRHNINKPLDENAQPYTYTYYDKSSDAVEHYCKCKCRKYARYCLRIIKFEIIDEEMVYRKILHNNIKKINQTIKDAEHNNENYYKELITMCEMYTSLYEFRNSIHTLNQYIDNLCNKIYNDIQTQFEIYDLSEIIIRYSKVQKQKLEKILEIHKKRYPFI